MHFLNQPESKKHFNLAKVLLLSFAYIKSCLERAVFRYNLPHHLFLFLKPFRGMSKDIQMEKLLAL